MKVDVIFKAFYLAYWLIKEEISNCKSSSLLDLLKLLGFDQNNKVFPVFFTGFYERNLFGTGLCNARKVVGKGKESILLWLG